MKEESKELQELRAYKAKSGLSFNLLGHKIGINPMSLFHHFRGSRIMSDRSKRLIRTFLEAIKNE